MNFNISAPVQGAASLASTGAVLPIVRTDRARGAASRGVGERHDFRNLSGAEVDGLVSMLQSVDVKKIDHDAYSARWKRSTDDCLSDRFHWQRPMDGEDYYFTPHANLPIDGLWDMDRANVGSIQKGFVVKRERLVDLCGFDRTLSLSGDKGTLYRVIVPFEQTRQIADQSAYVSGTVHNLNVTAVGPVDKFEMRAILGANRRIKAFDVPVEEGTQSRQFRVEVDEGHIQGARDMKIQIFFKERASVDFSAVKMPIYA